MALSTVLGSALTAWSLLGILSPFLSAPSLLMSTHAQSLSRQLKINIKKKITKYHFTPISLFDFSVIKKVEITSVGVNVEKLES